MRPGQMLKNKIARKLSVYFAVALVTFSVILSIAFIILFERYAIDYHQVQLADHAQAIAKNLSAYLIDCGNTEHQEELINFLLDISVNNLWIIENHSCILANCNGIRKEINFNELSAKQIAYIDEVLTGKTIYSNDFNDILTLPFTASTIGTPLKNDNDDIIGAILLHANLNTKNIAVSADKVIQAFVISTAIALIVTFVLTVFLSKNFTDPIISKEAEDALRLEKTRREFVANISHELRTPISVIKISMEAINDRIVTEQKKIENYNKQIYKEIIFLERLVNDLLDLSKLQNIEYSIKKSDFSLNDLLIDAACSSRQIASKKNVEIELTQDNEDCEIYGDYGRIRQMLLIIIDNAIKFSPVYSTVKITLTGKTLTIFDTGEGIPAADLPYIFDKFYKAPSEQNKIGTGLGLAIAKQIADRHGIKVHVQSDEGIGTTFEFLF